MMRMPSRFLLTCCSFLAFALGGCAELSLSRSDSTGGADERQGTYRQVEHGGELSPEELHARAKARVEPTKMVQHNEYVKTVEQVQREQAQHSRVVELERDVDVVKKEFKGLKGTVQTAAARTPDFQSASIEPAAAGTSVKNVRLGSHPGKTRVVFDLNAPSGVQYDLDNANKLLVIKLPGAGWDTQRERIFNGDKVLKAYAAKTTNDGDAIIVVKLQRPAKVLRSEKLGKNDAGYYRVFIDVAPL